MQQTLNSESEKAHHVRNEIAFAFDQSNQDVGDQCIVLVDDGRLASLAQHREKCGGFGVHIQQTAMATIQKSVVFIGQDRAFSSRNNDGIFGHCLQTATIATFQHCVEFTVEQWSFL